MNLEAVYKVNTPMFMGGAILETSKEIRPPAVKGLLRFWFRAAAFPLLGNIQKVQEKEKEIFGSTEKQASFLLSVTEQKKIIYKDKGHIWKKMNGLGYLGYGVVNYRGEVLRPYMVPGGSFTVHMQIKKKASQETAHFLKMSCKALGLFGGAGSRTRNGFGSLSLQSLRQEGKEIWGKPNSTEELAMHCRKFISELGLSKDNSMYPPYTAFGNNTRVWALPGKGKEEGVELLENIGRELLKYRSYGFARNVGDPHCLPWGEKAEQLYAGDHDLLIDYIKKGSIAHHPERAVFGLPHNYLFRSLGSAQVKVEPDSYNRRASPFFIHIHDLGVNNFAAIFTLLPSNFLPPGEEIKIKYRGQVQKVKCQVDYSVIEKFMDRNYFHNKVVVWP